MKRIHFPIFLATLYVVIYQLSPYMGFTENAIISMFVLSPVVVIWMVVRVLKDGEPSTKTFTDHFYEDYAYRRIPVREACEEELPNTTGASQNSNTDLL